MTPWRSALVSFAAGFLLTATSVGHDWIHHRFARFGTGVDVPVDLFDTMAEPDNSDGASFTAKDGARLLVFGSWNIDARSPATQLKWLIETDPKRYSRLTYKKVRRNFVVLSGTTDDAIYYERYRFDDPSDAIHALVIEYPASRRQIYEPLVKRISASLDWAKPL